MTKFHLLAAVAAALLATVVSAPVAYAQGGAPGPVTGIALLDVNAVFKEHPRFKVAMGDLEFKMKQAEEQVKQEKETIKKLGESLKEYRAGTPEYQQAEEQLAQRTSALQVGVTLRRKEFFQQQAKIYHTIYTEVEQEVAYVAQQNRIAVVLRYSGDPIDADNPEDILRGINKQIVYSAAGLDITPIIKERIVRRAGAAGMNPGAQPGPSARPGVPFQPMQR